MIHDDVLLKASQSLERPLDSEEQASLDAHLKDCTECRKEWAQMRDVHGALTVWGSEVAPPLPSLPPRPASPAAGTSTRIWPLLLAASLFGIIVGASGTRAIEARNAQRARTAAAAPVDSRPVFALLLEETTSSWPPTSGTMRSGYVEWRDSLRANATFAGGNQFALDHGWFVGSDGSALPVSDVPAGIRNATTYSGVFLVRAGSYEEAIAIARGSPHLRYGSILVRGVR